MKNELLVDALAMLRQAGIEPRVTRNRHWKIAWRDQHGRKRLLVVSSNRGARAQSRATLRRLLAS